MLDHNGFLGLRWFFSLGLYLVTKSDRMVGAGVLGVTTLGYVTVILCNTLVGVGVSILGGAG